MKEYDKYPTVSQDSEMDFEVRSSLFGRGECMTIGERGISGRIVVYLNEMSEGEEVLDKGKNIGRRCYSDIIICGYRKTSFLFGKRVQLIPEEEQADIKSKLTKMFSQERRNIRSVDFW